MSTVFRRVFVAATFVAAGLCLWGVEAGALGAPAPRIAATTKIPYGWVVFCRRYRGECDGPVLQARDIDLEERARGQIDAINRMVNVAIAPQSDEDHWGVIDQWDYPLDGKGDCEDYALLKRRLLIAAGFPRQALLMTVVRDLEGEGHAVLTITTDRGDFVLDNLSDDMKRADETGYQFIKRQSQEDPNVWVPLDGPDAAPLYTAR